jgi:hypothetical protein
MKKARQPPPDHNGGDKGAVLSHVRPVGVTNYLMSVIAHHMEEGTVRLEGFTEHNYVCCRCSSMERPAVRACEFEPNNTDGAARRLEGFLRTTFGWHHACKFPPYGDPHRPRVLAGCVPRLE